MSATSIARHRWRVLPVGVPTLRRLCPRCGAPQSFSSSGRFRVNANGQTLDVWLIYKCARCERTLNLPVVERTAGHLVKHRLRYEQNDEQLARRTALQLGDRLAFAEATDFSIEKLACPEDDGAPMQIELQVPWPVSVRLDRVLARGLGWSRTAVKRRACGGPPLRRAVRDGLVVVVR